MKSDQRIHNFKVFLLVFLGTVIFYRLLIQLIGDRSVYIFGTEIHHLYFGVILLLLTGFTRFFSVSNKLNNLDLILFGVGCGLVTDEFIYILFTPGDHSSYFSNISVYGAVISSLILTVLFYAIFRGIYYEKK